MTDFKDKTLSDGSTLTAGRQREICAAQADGVYRPERHEGHRATDGTWFAIDPMGSFPILPKEGTETGPETMFGTREQVQAFVEYMNRERPTWKLDASS